MSSTWVMGFLASTIGMSSGGLFALLLKGFQRSISTIFALCAGMMVGLISLDILPEGVEVGGWVSSVVGVLAGVVLFQLADKYTHKVVVITENEQRDTLLHSGILLSVSIAIHNLPMGIVLGASTKESLSQSMMTTIILHNIPEGIAVFMPLIMAGFGAGSLLLGTLVVSVPVGIGALIGQQFGMGVPWALAVIIGIAIGVVIVVTIKEIFLEAVRKSSVFYASVISLLGFLLIFAYLYYV